MRNFCKLILALVLAGVMAEAACAQLTNITAPASSVSFGAAPIATGNVVFVPVDSSGHGIPVTKSGGGLSLPAPSGQIVGYPCTISAGAITGTCAIPDAGTSAPSGFAYNITITDSSTGGPTSGMAVTLTQVHGITGATWALDHYAPALSVSTASAFTLTSGVGAPTGTSTGPAFYVDVTTPSAPVLYLGGASGYAALGGSDSGAVTAAAIATALGSQSGCSTAGYVYLPASNNCSALPVGVSPGQVAAQLSVGVNRATALNPITQVANSVISQDHFYFSDGTDYWTAGPGYASQGIFIDDFTLAAMQNPAYFTAPQIINIVTKFMAAVNAHGEIPAAVGPTGAASLFYSGADLHQAYAAGDGWIMVPQLCYLHYLKSGSTACYTANVAAIKTALAYFPRNASTHLPTVVPGNEYIAGTLFQETVRKTGDDANASVWLARVDQVMGLMATAAGDTANATYFDGDFATVKASIASVLTDSSSQMLLAATIQDNQIDIPSTVLAVYYGFLPTSQASSISNYLNTNYAAITHDGYILQSPTCWAQLGTIPASGGPPYTTVPACNTYQSGYWTYHFAWFAAALGINHPSQVVQLLEDYGNGSNPTTEYIDRDFTIAGSDLNLESPQGPKLAADLFPPPFTVTPGLAVVDRFGRIAPGVSGAKLLITSNPGNNVLTVQNSSNSGFAAFNANDLNGNAKMTFGYGNPGAPSFAGINYIFSITTPFCLTTTYSCTDGLNMDTSGNATLGHNLTAAGTAQSSNAVVTAIKATTGTRYVCVDTNGNLVSSATACSGT